MPGRRSGGTGGDSYVLLWMVVGCRWSWTTSSLGVGFDLKWRAGAGPGKGSTALRRARPCARARRGWGLAAGIFQPSDGAGNLARSFYVHVEQDLRKYLVWVQAPQVLPCWRSRNGCSLPTSVCLSVRAWVLHAVLGALLAFSCASLVGGEGSLCFPAQG